MRNFASIFEIYKLWFYETLLHYKPKINKLQWRTEGGGLGVQPPPEIPKAL